VILGHSGPHAPIFPTARQILKKVLFGTIRVRPICWVAVGTEPAGALPASASVADQEVQVLRSASTSVGLGA